MGSWNDESRITDVIGFAPVPRVRGEVATLTLVTGPGAGAVHEIVAPRVVLGRGLQADILIPDGAVSRLHARITREGHEYVFEDLNSRNGSFLNCTLLRRPVMLAPGDVVQLGSATRLAFGFAEERRRPRPELEEQDRIARLPSRRVFVDQLQRELSFASRHGTGLSLLVLQISSLERIAHRHGRQAAERVVGVVGASLTEILRIEDLASLVAEDTLAVLVRGVPEGDVLELAERLRARIESTDVLWSGRRLALTSSVGIAHARDASSAAAMIDAACDAARATP